MLIAIVVAARATTRNQAPPPMHTTGPCDESTTPRMMPQRGERHRNIAIIRSEDLGFPPEVAEGDGSFTSAMPSRRKRRTRRRHHRLRPKTESKVFTRICSTNSKHHSVLIGPPSKLLLTTSPNLPNRAHTRPMWRQAPNPAHRSSWTAGTALQRGARSTPAPPSELEPPDEAGELE